MRLLDLIETQDIQYQTLRRGVTTALQRALSHEGLKALISLPQVEEPKRGPWRGYTLLTFRNLPLVSKKDDAHSRPFKEQLDAVFSTLYQELERIFPDTYFENATGGRGIADSFIQVGLDPGWKRWGTEELTRYAFLGDPTVKKNEKPSSPHLRLVKNTPPSSNDV